MDDFIKVLGHQAFWYEYHTSMFREYISSLIYFDIRTLLGKKLE